MIDYSVKLVSALKTILPTYYELYLHSGLDLPCISYQERNNALHESGDTLGYSRISYTIKVWSNDIAELQQYAKKIDDCLRPLGWRRISTQELGDNQTSIIQKIMTYEAIAYEDY